jgi:hypothetical protein
MNVTWKIGIDSHDELIKIAGYKDNTTDSDKMQFCRVEISPKNRDYLNPDKWVFRIDTDVVPAWMSEDHEKKCWQAFRDWERELNKILIRKPIIHPFKDVEPPEKITDEHIGLLKEWTSVRTSVWDSVGASVGILVGVSVRASVWDSVWDSVKASVVASLIGVSVGDLVKTSVWALVRDSVVALVWDSVEASVWDSVEASVVAYSGSFFSLPREAWKHTNMIETEEYPFQSAVQLWEMGLVPSFDGKVWRLHGGPDGKVLWEGVI